MFDTRGLSGSARVPNNKLLALTAGAGIIAMLGVVVAGVRLRRL